MLRLHEFTFWAGRLPLKFLPAYCEWHVRQALPWWEGLPSDWARIKVPWMPGTCRGVG